MTTIAAKVSNGKARIAWDSQVTAGSARSFGMNKVVKINDQFAVGISGHLRYGNLIHRTSINKIHPFDLKQADFDGYGWLLDEAIPSWMKAVKKDTENQPDEEAGVSYGTVLVVLANRLYTVDHDFSVSMHEDFTAIGSGSEFAITAMHLGKSARQSVVVATELDLYTGGEVKELVV